MQAAIFGVAATVLAGAAVAEPPAGASWRVTDAPGLVIEAADEVTLDFAEGRIAGRSGCNRYSAAVTLTAQTPAAGAMALGPVISTRMACIGRAGDIEWAFLGALGRVTGYRIEPDGSLTLTGDDTALIRALRR